MSENNEKNRKSIVNIGTSLMVVILIGMSFAVIAALAISSAKNNYDLSSMQAEHTKEYYEASNKAYEAIDSDCWKDNRYEIAINDSQNLVVEIKNQTIIEWKVENTSDWDGEESLPVHISDEMF